MRIRYSVATKRTLGKYEVVERIGRGGMAEVYRGYHAALDRYVAIKLLHPFLADDPEFKDRFEKEAKNVAKLRHPNIVQVFDFEYDSQGESFYMVMELITGPTMKDLLYEKQVTSQRFSIHEAARIIADTSNALAYAHKRGMIHRDIKPANIMLDEDERVVLTDFGIAKIVTGGHFTASGGMVGTPAYMAPEQGLGEAGDERSDIYSLGVMLYQMVTGELPYDADTPLAIILKHVNDPIPDPREYVPTLPQWLIDIIYTSMEKDPDRRYQSATTLLNNIRQGVKQGTKIGPVETTTTTNHTAEPLLSQQLDETDVPRVVESTGKIVLPEHPTSGFKPITPEELRARTGPLPNEITATMPSEEYQDSKRANGSRRLQLIGVLVILALLVASAAFGLQDGGPLDNLLNDEPTNTEDANSIAVAQATPTTTLTASASPTPSETLTPSLTLTPSETPTETATPSPSDTLTFTPSYTPSETPTVTATFTETPDPTQTAAILQTQTQEAEGLRQQTLESAQTATQDAITFATQTVSVAQTATQDARTFATQTQRAARTATQDAIALVTSSAVPAAADEVEALRQCERDYVLLAPLALSTPPLLTDALNPRLLRAETDFTLTLEIENASTCDWPADGRLELVFVQDTSETDINYEELSETCDGIQPVFRDINFTEPQRPRIVTPAEDYPRDSVLTLEINFQAPDTRGCYFGAWQLQFTDYDRLTVGEPIVIAIQVFGGQ